MWKNKCGCINLPWPFSSPLKQITQVSFSMTFLPPSVFFTGVLFKDKRYDYPKLSTLFIDDMQIHKV